MEVVGGDASPGLLVIQQRTGLALEELGVFSELSMENNGQKASEGTVFYCLRGESRRCLYRRQEGLGETRFQLAGKNHGGNVLPWEMPGRHSADVLCSQ